MAPMTSVPTDLAPMLASPGPLPVEDGRWAYEVKWDGFRALVAVDGEQVSLRSRTGLDTTRDFPSLAAVRAPVSVLLDAEVVALDGAGRPDFGLLQNRGRQSAPLALIVFDVLHLAGRSLLDEPYDDRRARLEDLGLTGAQVPPAFIAGGAALLDSTREQGLEGVVAKRRDSRYEPGRRSDCWVKVKNVRRQSAVVVGWRPGEGGRAGHLGSLLLAVQGPGGLVYVGRVGTGFRQADLVALTARLADLAEDRPTCEVPPDVGRQARWVRPELVAEVELTGWTRDGRLRHPSYKGLRADLAPADVVRE